MSEFNLRPHYHRGGLGWYRHADKRICVTFRFEPRCIWLGSIRVEPEYRNQGVGTQAMQALIALATRRKLGVRLLAEPDRGRDRRKLYRWYKRLGFRRCSGGHFYYAPQ